MIYVTYDGESSLEVRGHAGTAAPGKDLVCAAVTALVLTLQENCRESGIRRGKAWLRGGSPEIFRAMGRGFALLARQYPYAVHYKCIGDRVSKH